MGLLISGGGCMYIALSVAELVSASPTSGDPHSASTWGILRKLQRLHPFQSYNLQATCHHCVMLDVPSAVSTADSVCPWPIIIVSGPRTNRIRSTWNPDEDLDDRWWTKDQQDQKHLQQQKPTRKPQAVEWFYPLPSLLLLQLLTVKAPDPPSVEPKQQTIVKGTISRY